MQPRRRGRDTEFVTPRLAYGFVGLVGASSGLMAGAGGATLAEIALLSGLGLTVGVVLLVAIGITPWTGK
jgi:L-cystine uptake protein TcyP (sodium:dicarboxylate symporter family)